MWTAGTAGGATIFIPFLRVRQSDAPSVRVSFLLESVGAANIEVRPATRGSNDGWTYPVATGTAWAGNAAYTSTAGWSWGGSYYAPDDDYQWIEFGFNVQNKTGGGTGRESALVTLVLDVQK